MADRDRAARVLAAGGSQTAAAEAAGVNRSTITRWVKEPEFAALVTAAADDPANPGEVSEKAQDGLAARVPAALEVIDQALAGDKGAIQASRVAIDVIKLAAQLAPKELTDSGAPPLATLLKELDASAGTGDQGEAARDDRAVS